MTEKTKAYVCIGKIGTPYGIKGWLKVHAYTELNSNILSYQPWYLSSDHQHWTVMPSAEGKPHGHGMIIKFPNLHTPEEARLLTGKLIGIPRTQLPKLKKDEYYWSDLENLNVIDQHGNHLGKVIYMMETGTHDVLIVKGAKELAIPYLPGKVIINVDLIKQQIHVNWDS